MAVTFSTVKAKALSQLGVKESPAGSNMTKYGQWYGLNGVPWCAIFQSWCFGQAGWIEGMYGKGASVSQIRQRFEETGRYGTTPRVGALAIFQDDAHIELVLSVGAKSIYSVGGNTSSGTNEISNGGMVAAKYRSLTKIKGYCYPAYAPATVKSPISGAFPLTTGHWYGVNDGTSKSHSGIRGIPDSTNVKKIQNKLSLKQDGNFGPMTKAAVVSYQKARGGLTVDGKVGPATWSAMSK